ncbi:hypothetical protein NLG97_g1041 [Lecanicillium saksenae]|uniref:Uncharacterized protein n=1 Tax=Lecanicillium saksenae TaxID=468837 RepID=A0ACC1R4V7_9HYPO|nr:hypothetical protein NLG97_g1041 [Lecanicillium saksenae]
MDEALIAPEPVGPSDFLLAVEQLCCLVPSLVIIFNTPFYICKLFSHQRRIRIDHLLLLKLALLGVLSAVQIKIVFQWWDAVPDAPRLARAEALAAYISMPSLTLSILLDHLYSDQQAPFLSGTLFITLLVDVAAFPTYFYSAELVDSPSPHWTVIGLKLLILLLEQLPKHPLEARGGSIRRGDLNDLPLWKWANLFVLFGFRSKIEKEDDAELDNENNATMIQKRFSDEWKKADKGSRLALLKACFYTKPGMFLAYVTPRLMHAVFTLAKPLLIRDVLIMLSISPLSLEMSSRLITTTAIVYLGATISASWSLYAKARLIGTLEQILNSAAYHKSLLLNGSDLEAASVKGIINNDVVAAIAGLHVICSDWACSIEIFCCLVYLAAYSGVFTLLALLPLAGVVKIVSDIHDQGQDNRTEWRRRAEDHIAFVSNVLGQLRDIKMLGLGSAVSKVMKRYQENEIYASILVRMAGKADIAAGIQASPSHNTSELIKVGAFVETVTPLMALAIAIAAPGTFQPQSLADFASLIGVALFLGDSYGSLARTLTNRFSGLESLQKLHDFMLREENRDPRLCAPDRLRGAADVASAAPARRRGRGRYTRAHVSSEFVFQFIDVSVAFNGDDPVLQNVFLRIPRGKVTMITGSVGCGKSTFLKLLIGQVKLSCGTLLAACTRVAYCAQRPWIRNLSIRDNILGESPLNRAWLNFILHVTALDIDLARLPNGESTIAGSDGCNLSGGQKHRIAFARALYAKMEVIVVDDIFASLDKVTSSTIRIRLFGESEILSANNMTLIMSTSQRTHAVDADLVFEINHQGHVHERSLASRDASPSYTPNLPRDPQAGVNEQDLETATAAQEDDDLPVDPVSHLSLPSVGYSVVNPISGKFRDVSLYKFFYFGPVGSFITVLFLTMVSIAAIAELLPGVFIYFWMATDAQDATFLLVYAGFCFANPVFNYFCNLFTQDVFETTEGLPRLMVPFVWAIISVATFFVAFYWATSTLLFPTALAIGQVGMSFFYRRAADNMAAIHGAPRSKLAGLASFLEQFHAYLEELYHSSHHGARLSQWSFGASNAVTAAAAIGIVTIVLKSTEPVSEIAVGFVFVALMGFAFQIDTLAVCLSASDSALSGAQQARAFIQSTPQELDPEEYDDVPIDWPQRGQIQLNCVTAQYRPVGGVRHTALDHVSFTVQPGQIVGIAGHLSPIFSGKTSIFLAILNLLQFEGSISIDNREIRSVPRDILRSRITTMTQSGLELKGTVRLNIDPFNAALRPREFMLTDDMLIGILRRVGLWNRIAARGGLDAPFHRMKFSNGQKQLFHLARAILHKQSMRTKIILIDEGAPNTEIEEHVRQVMREVFHGCTILMVSHRLALFHEADLIVTVDRGQTIAYEHDRQRANWSIGRWNRPMD